MTAQHDKLVKIEEHLKAARTLSFELANEMTRSQSITWYENIHNKLIGTTQYIERIKERV